jgi:hypothetical protein
MTRLMISYSAKRKTVAKELKKRLGTVEGIKPKVDCVDLQAGDKWRADINLWLSACQSAVVLLCPDAVESPWVLYELSILAHRDLVEEDFCLILVCLGGLTHREIAARAEFEPCGLGELQVVHHFSSCELTYHELDSLTEDIVRQCRNLSVPAEILVGEAHGVVASVPHGRVVSARTKLRSEAQPDEDPWDFESPVALSVGAEHATRWRFAADFCAAPVDSANVYGALQELVKDGGVRLGDADKLVDVGMKATADARAVNVLDTVWRSKEMAAAVIAGTMGETAATMAAATETLRSTNTSRVHHHNGDLTGSTDDDYVSGVVEWLRGQIAPEEDLDEYLRYHSRRKHPLYIVLQASSGLSADFIERLADRTQPATVLVLASPHASPGSVATQLTKHDSSTYPIAGAHIGEDVWPRFVEQEAGWVEARYSLRADLARVRGATR